MTVISWDYIGEPASTTETWIQVSERRFTEIMGGMPNVVVATDSGVYRNSKDGRRWRLVRKEVPVDA